MQLKAYSMALKYTKESRKYLSPYETRESKCGELPGVHPVLIQVPNIDLDRGVVLRSNQPVSGRTARTDIYK